MKRIEDSVQKTLAFYETRACGRSANQLFPYLIDCQSTPTKLHKALDRLVEDRVIVRIGEDYGFSQTSAKRTSEAAHWVDAKRPIAERIATTMKSIPFVRMVALTQSVAMETAHETSDVDIFTVTAENRLWTARFFSLLRLKIVGLAKRTNNTSNHGCFGFWIDESALNLKPILIEEDVYLSFWLAHAIPLVNKNQTYERFVSKNRTLLSHFPNWRKKSPLFPLSKGGERVVTPLWQRGAGGDFMERILRGRLGDLLEVMLFRIQAKKIWRDSIAHRNGASVVASSSMCKLHHFDQRTEIRDSWKQLIESKNAHTRK